MTRNPSVPLPASSRDGARKTKGGQPGWELRVWDAKAGRQRQKTFYGSEREAHAAIAKLRDEVAAARAPQLPQPHTITVGQWAIEFLRRYKWKVRPVKGQGGVPRPKTAWKNAKANASAYIVPGLGENRRMVTIQAKDLEQLITTLKVRDYAFTDKERALPPAERPVRWKPADADTKDKTASITRLMFAEVAKVFLTTDPANDLRTVWGVNSRAARVVIPSLKQVEDLACAMDADWPARGDIIRVFPYTGLRWENLAALDLDDVDMAHRSIHVWRSSPSSTGELVEELKGGGDDYFITIIDEAVAPLERLAKFAADRGSTRLLTGERGGPLNYSLWRKHLDRARAATGVPYTAHSLRHVCASLLIAGGASIERVRGRMGHKSDQVTQRVYRHALKVDRRELAKQFRLPTTGIDVDNSVDE